MGPLGRSVETLILEGSSPTFTAGSLIPIGSMYGIYANIGGILMVNVTIYSIHGSYGIFNFEDMLNVFPRM